MQFNDFLKLGIGNTEYEIALENELTNRMNK